MWQRHASLVAVLCLATNVAHAIKSYENLFELSLEELVNIPITGATYIEETRATVPSAVSVFDRQQIQQLGVESLAELANLAPGFQVLRSGDTSGYSTISSRGRRIAPVSAEILLLVDGRRTKDLRLSGISTTLDMPLSNVERVEFIRGPGAALYGSGAMMGVINVITVTRENLVSVEAGSNDDHHVSLLAGGENELLQYDFHMDYAGSSGHSYVLPDRFTGEPFSTQDPYKRTNILVKGTYSDFSASLRYAKQDYRQFYVLEIADPDVSEHIQVFKEVAIEHHWQRDNVSSKTTITAATSDNKLSTRLSPPGVYASVSAPSSDAPLIVAIETVATEIGLAHQTSLQLNQNHQLLFGAEYIDDEITKDNSATNFGVGGLVTADLPVPSSPQADLGSSIYSMKEQRYFGMFGQWHAHLRKQTQLTLGVRFDKYPNIDETNISPRISLVEKLNDHHHIKLLYGEAFRAPNIHELGLSDNEFISGNPNLLAETVSTTELIWFGRHNAGIWSLGYFTNHFDDPILQKVIASDGLFRKRQYINSTHDDINGVEAEMQFKLTDTFFLSGTMTKILSTDDLAYRESSELGSITANYSKGRWNLNISAAYRGDRGNSVDNQNALGRYWLSYAKVLYSLNSALQVQLRLGNLDANEVYYPAQGGANSLGIPSRNREWHLGLNWQF